MTTQTPIFDAPLPPTATVPSMTWRTLAHAQPSKELPKGIDAIWDTGVGLLKRVVPRRSRYLRQAATVVRLEGQFKDLSDARLRAAALDTLALFRTRKDERADVYRAMALVREVAKRQIGETPYLEQVAGALALYDANMVEMATGEGKTLTATMPATLAGWRGRGCHVITVNDYLARRDATNMGKIYNFCGLSVAHIEGEFKPPVRRDAYLADITYTTNKEVCADFLRDRLVLGRLRDLPSALLQKMLQNAGTDRLVLRGMHYAIVDEADSVLIDEAVTPLIISGDAPNNQAVEAFRQAAEIAGKLVEGQDFKANNRYRDVEITDAGLDRIADLAEQYGGIWKGARRSEELINQALVAKHFYVRGKQYVINDSPEKNKSHVVIVDEFTGRLMPDRTWRDGLHQAIEAKDNVTVLPPKDTYARISFQRFFRFYDRLSGMTGTVQEAVREVWQIYHRPIVVIPTHKPCIRKTLPDRIYSTESAKLAAITQEIKRLHESGRPILVGTRSVRASERLSDLLTAGGMAHQVLNAVRHAEEAQIMAQAGQRGAITIATNMAGRGTDIKLGRGVADLGGLAVIATERHEARRIDRQLFGRSGRQGDPGTAQAFVALEDELLARNAPHLVAMAKRRHGQVATEITSRLLQQLFDLAQRRAQRQALSQRKGVLHADDWLDESLGFAGSER